MVWNRIVVTAPAKFQYIFLTNLFAWKCSYDDMCMWVFFFIFIIFSWWLLVSEWVSERNWLVCYWVHLCYLHSLERVNSTLMCLCGVCACVCVDVGRCVCVSMCAKWRFEKCLRMPFGLKWSAGNVGIIFVFRLIFMSTRHHSFWMSHRNKIYIYSFQNWTLV